MYLTDERWEHILDGHPEMEGYEEALRDTIRFDESESGRPAVNNYVVTAFQKQIG